MDNLNAKEVKIFNNLSRVQSPSVSLGNKMQGVIDKLNAPFPGTLGSPVNAVAAKAILEISGVVFHGETVTINNPLTEGFDVYEFVADSAQSVSVETNYPVDITRYVTPSSINLVVDIQPMAGDKMTIGGKEYTFVALGTAAVDGDIDIGASLADTQAAIVEAINGVDEINTPNAFVSASLFDGDTDISVITALIGGTSGDLIEVSETFTGATNIFSGVKLTNGADCSAANAVTALALAITTYDTQDVVGTDGDGNVVDLTFKIAGVIGNEVGVATDLINGTFTNAATKLAGGIDGTIASIGNIQLDETYLYIAMANNTTADRNWRRIDLGSAY